MFNQYNLGASNTPLTFLPEFSEYLGAPFYVKRDELSAITTGLAGSDARKIEFLLPDVARVGATDAVIAGTYGSTFMRMLVQALSVLGVKCQCVFIDEFQPIHQYNLSVMQMCGADTHGTQTPEYADSLVDALVAAGNIVYTTRHGGAGSIAAMGGFALMDELYTNLTVANEESVTIYVASDSGTLLSGMLAASVTSELQKPRSAVPIIGVPISCTAEQQALNVIANFKAFAELAATEKDLESLATGPIPTVLMSDPAIEYHGATDIDLAKMFMHYSGVLLDPVYGLPVLAAIVRDVKDGSVEGPIVFVNPTKDTSSYFNYTT